jgi:beta-galactosidase
VHIVRKEENAGGGAWVSNWTPTDFGTYDNASLQVYSNCDEVELFLNDKSLGAKKKPADDSPRNWEVNFEKGTLRAVGKNNGQQVATEEFKTAGAPAKIILTADQASLGNNWEDVSFITATIVDANGIPCPNEDTKIKFNIDGAGVIEAVDNGNLSSHDIYKATEYPTYHGKSLAIVKAKGATGKATISATAEGLEKSNAVEISIK